MIKILFVDYDINFIYIIKKELEDIIEEYQVLFATNKDDGKELWKREKPDVLVCDVDVLGEKAFNIPIRIRMEDPNVLILYMISNSSPKDIILGYHNGVNGYLKKPFIPRELSAFIQSLLSLKNRTQPEAIALSTKIGDYIFDPFCCALLHENKSKKIPLTYLEMLIVSMLCERRGLVVLRSDFAEKIWNVKNKTDHYVSRRLDSAVTKLKKKILMETGKKLELETIRGVGLKLL